MWRKCYRLLPGFHLFFPQSRRSLLATQTFENWLEKYLVNSSSKWMLIRKVYSKYIILQIFIRMCYWCYRVVSSLSDSHFSYRFLLGLQGLELIWKDASFLAIDAEFTGLKENSTKFSPLDTPPDRFDKIIKSSMRFLVIQFGLSIFQYDCTKSNYSNKTYNFYVFPNSSSYGRNDNFFVSQASCLHLGFIGFSCIKRFDFNRLIKDGKILF